MAVIFWFIRTFPEAPIRVQSRRGTDLTPVPDHPLTELIATPNPYYPGELLWWGTLADWMLTGNGYWLKVRSAAGRVVQLWWAPSTTMTAIRPDDGGVFLSHYEYSPNGKPTRVEAADVVHFRYGLNPGDGGLTGLSPLASLLREVFTDDEAANFTASLLRNMGVPGVVLSPRGDDEVGSDDAEELKNEFRQRFSGDNVGEPMVMKGPTDVAVLSFNPQQMELTKLRRIPEERVSALFGIPAVVVGLGAGLDRATYANFAEAREAAYEQNVIPSQRLLAAQIRTQLLPDFGDVRRLVVDFDLSLVRVLQDDQNELATRITTELTGGAIMLDEARSALGKPPLPNRLGQVYYIPTGVTVTPADEVGAEPEPPPMPPALALPPGDEAATDDAGEAEAETAPTNGRRREAVPAA
jgi:HK97 family phage portal protein